jgi:peptidoglycan/xylan/chitin deacetylase (PgdA/CDA1 family)
MKIDFDPPEQGGGRITGHAVCCFSVDFDATRRERLGPNSVGTVALLQIAERYKIPITWAICGKTADEDRESYQAILNSASKAEIAVHTYSHIDASICSPEEFVSDVRHCIAALKLENQPRSFVFPWNREGHLSFLRDLGFTAYRGATRRVGRPLPRSGLWCIPPLFYMGAGAYRASSLLERFLEICSNYGALFHIWTHPWDLVNPGVEDYLSSTVEPIFKKISQLRTAGRVETLTMGEVADMYSMDSAKSAIVTGQSSAVTP